MKPHLLALLVAAALPTLAQSASPTRLNFPGQYCTVVARGASYSALQFRVDYGNYSAKYTGITAEQMKEDNAKLKKFFSIADVLNYLSGRGWELVNVSTLADDITYPETTPVLCAGSTIETFHSEVKYLLRRRGE
jgi:hypothetical protein